MSLLIRLFPEAWRDRYAPEFEALLEGIPLTPAVVADVVVASARTRLRGAVEAPFELSVPAIAGIAGGATWALTIGIGFALAWGRYGKDLGFIALIVAATALLIAESRMARHWSGRGRNLARLGDGASGAGLAVLLLGLAAAVVLEPPWLIRLGLAPTDYWTAGMLLTLAGAALLGLGLCLSPGGHTIIGAAIVVSAVSLAFALLIPLGEPRVSEAYTIAEDGSKVVAWASLSLPKTGWFTTDPVVGLVGAVFGLAWMAVGIQESRIAHSPGRGAPGGTTTALPTPPHEAWR